MKHQMLKKLYILLFAIVYVNSVDCMGLYNCSLKLQKDQQQGKMTIVEAHAIPICTSFQDKIVTLYINTESILSLSDGEEQNLRLINMAYKPIKAYIVPEKPIQVDFDGNIVSRDFEID